MADEFRYLDEAINATQSAAVAGEILRRVLNSYRNGHLTVAELHDETSEPTAIILLSAEQMRKAMHEFRSGERRSAGGGL